MTIGEYIEQKFQTFGIELSGADILDISLSSGLGVDENVTGDNINSVTVAIVKFIPDLLLRYSSFSEGDLSMSWADMKEKITAWYSLRCAEYGLEDKLSDKPTVNFW